MIEVHLREYCRPIQIDSPDAEAALWELGRPDAVALEQLPSGSWDSFWLDKANGTLYRMHAGTKQRALAKGFERYKLAARHPAPAMKVFNIYLARTGERLVIEAEDWRDAVRQAGRPDACEIQQFNQPYGPYKGPSFTAWFDPALPQGVAADSIDRALEGVVLFLDGAERGREGRND